MQALLKDNSPVGIPKPGIKTLDLRLIDSCTIKACMVDARSDSEIVKQHLAITEVVLLRFCAIRTKFSESKLRETVTLQCSHSIMNEVLPNPEEA